jgi:hypothetical protein
MHALKPLPLTLSSARPSPLLSLLAPCGMGLRCPSQAAGGAAGAGAVGPGGTGPLQGAGPEQQGERSRREGSLQVRPAVHSLHSSAVAACHQLLSKHTGKHTGVHACSSPKSCCVETAALLSPRTQTKVRYICNLSLELHVTPLLLSLAPHAATHPASVTHTMTPVPCCGAETGGFPLAGRWRFGSTQTKPGGKPSRLQRGRPSNW